MQRNPHDQGDAMFHPRRKRDSKDRRDFFGLALLGLANGSLPGSPMGACQASEAGQPAKLQGLSPKGAPAAAPGYSPGIRAEGRRVVFVSGQGPKDVKADMEVQIRQTFERIGLILKEAETSFQNVVMLRAYFV